MDRRDRLGAGTSPVPTVLASAFIIALVTVCLVVLVAWVVGNAVPSLARASTATSSIGAIARQGTGRTYATSAGNDSRDALARTLVSQGRVLLGAPCGRSREAGGSFASRDGASFGTPPGKDGPRVLGTRKGRVIGTTVCHPVGGKPSFAVRREENAATLRVTAFGSSSATSLVVPVLFTRALQLQGPDS